ncbi:MotE family protein [Halarcobacter bivalviorum]|uniref:Motility protein chaperone MotE n=1 Tax=Halarcobacter bivalviorum TaxID=663364 RepID=A0AB33GH56_9BACT|nr:hypothetical protein [Halarcobacter bivalviorum]AXH13353.1 hypothetical protein ABIV_2379 [Halarcobacter bivalviorum]
MIRVVFLFLISFIVLNAQEERVTSAALIKQKIEVKELKKELNTFYNKKEKEYQERKKELLDLIKKVETEKKAIEKIRNENLQLLQDINGEVEAKTSKIYNKMKPKVAASIFNEMINNGKVEDVFDIILRLKENNVTSLMKFLSPKNAAILTLMLKEYRAKNQDEG